MSWAETLKKHPEANFLQSPSWAKMNELIGAEVITEEFENGDRALLIVRDAKRGRYLEVPCGPLIDWSNKEVVDKVFARIKEIAKEKHCVFVRIRPQLERTPENLKLLKTLGLKPSPMHLAAEHTVLIDLKKSEDELLAEMRRQTRYEVKRAEKQGIVLEKSNSEKIFREFHTVQAETAKRKGFIPPSLKVLLAEREALGDNAKIYIASTPEKAPIAYGLIITCGKEADYYEAASTELNYRLSGAYALIWQVIKDTKAAGFERLNLWGIAPAGQPHHRYAGVTTFKTGFGGVKYEFVPAHDLVISKVKYVKNFIVETVRHKKRHL